MAVLEHVRPREGIMPRMRSYLVRAGYAATLSKVSPEIMAMAREVYREALEVAEPLAATLDLAADEMPEELVPSALHGSKFFSMMLFSLGEKLDRKIDELFLDGEPLRAVLFDAWGSESVEALADGVDAELRKTHGLGTLRFAPGYGGFDIRRNADWLRTLKKNADFELSVEVDAATGIIAPRKSILCMIGWGHDPT